MQIQQNHKEGLSHLPKFRIYSAGLLSTDRWLFDQHTQTMEASQTRSRHLAFC